MFKIDAIKFQTAFIEMQQGYTDSHARKLLSEISEKTLTIVQELVVTEFNDQMAKIKNPNKFKYQETANAK